MMTKVLGVSFCALLAFSAGAQDAPPQQLTAQEVLMLENIQLKVKLVKALNEEIDLLKERQSTLQDALVKAAADRQTSFLDYQKEVEGQHPGMTTSDFGDLVKKPLQPVPSKNR